MDLESAWTGNFCSPIPIAPIFRYFSSTARASGMSGSSFAKNTYSAGYCRAIATTVSLPPAPAEGRYGAFRPRAHPAVPALARNPIDAFILAQLHKEGLKPAPAANRRTLIRRAWFDLPGLPPSPEEIERFVRDRSPDAWPRLVDRLLDTPEYAEHWAQHWLDVVRFAESDGFEYDTHRSDAWRYRDYAIRSFREDKPYDQFLREQLAGDQIDPKNQEMLVASGFN